MWSSVERPAKTFHVGTFLPELDDLRNPLTVAKGNLDLLHEEQNLPEDRLDSIEGAHSRKERV